MPLTAASRWRTTWAVLAAAGVAALWWWAPVSGTASASASSASAWEAPFCETAPAQAHADASQRADREAAVKVPLATPPPGQLASATQAVKQGEVVRVSVQSPRDGAVAVHGLLDVQPVHAGQTVTVAFRAIYSGRFPLHFHGTDGSHFELAAFEVGGG